MAARDKVVKKVQQKKGPTKLFVRERMWLQYILSSHFKDMGKIPKDIGNNILFHNSMYITSEYLSSIIQIDEITGKTPVTLIAELNRELRKLKINALLDFTIKNNEYFIDVDDSGLKSRVRVWKKTLEDERNGLIPDSKYIQKCVSLLYTVGELKKGKKAYLAKMFITVRAKNRTNLIMAEEAIVKYARKLDWDISLVNNVRDRLRYMSLVCDARDTRGKDIPDTVMTNTTMSQMFANGSSSNDKEGLFMAVDIKTNTPYRLDLTKITSARNIYIIAPSGVGKTVMASRMCESALEQGMHVTILDIKGNEMVNFTNSNNGKIVSLRSSSTEYIDTFKMHKQECTDGDANMYFNSRLVFSKTQLLILSGLVDDALQEGSIYLEEFFNSMYIALGVESSNRNSWYNTLTLTPYDIYGHLCEYTTEFIMSKYPLSARKIIKSLYTYMSPDGASSHIFREELNYKELLDAPVLMFDFGLLSTSDVDEVGLNIFKLKFAYTEKINAEFVTNKYNKGIKVFKVLEESQIVDDTVMKAYVREFTLRRAQGQTTVLLGNSVQALMDNSISKPLIENTKALLIGKLPDTALKLVLKEFDLYEYEDELASIGTSEELDNAFLFINRMEANPIRPMLKVMLDKNKKYLLHTPNEVKL